MIVSFWAIGIFPSCFLTFFLSLSILLRITFIFSFSLYHSYLFLCFHFYCFKSNKMCAYATLVFFFFYVFRFLQRKQTWTFIFSQPLQLICVRVCKISCLYNMIINRARAGLCSHKSFQTELADLSRNKLSINQDQPFTFFQNTNTFFLNSPADFNSDFKTYLLWR